jgi:hypothetical protein
MYCLHLQDRGINQARSKQQAERVCNRVYTNLYVCFKNFKTVLNLMSKVDRPTSIFQRVYVFVYLLRA